MPSASDIVNRALELTGSQVTVTGTNPAFDGTPAGNAAGVLYSPCVQLLMRQMDPAFARRTAALVAAITIAPPGWNFAYVYPADALRIRQVRPTVGNYNSNDPQPVRATIYFDQGLAKKCIATNLAAIAAAAVYTSSLPIENEWDQGFLEAVARRLANPLAMALAGRPDFARELLEEADRLTAAGELTDEM